MRERHGSPAIVIVADDLSSATDCSVQMIVGGYRAVVPLSFRFPIPADVDIVAFDTDSRNLSAEQAYQAIRRCVAGRSLDPRAALYKSVDSTLRGNLGAEIEALLETGWFDAAIVAPAFPTYGRTTLDGHQFLDGVPLHETEFGSDPTAPVGTSAVLGRIAEQCGRAGALVSLETQRKGPDALRALIEDRRAAGVEIFVFDAVEEEDLERLAVSVGALPLRVLWVGSTGLSRYLPKALSLRPRAAPAPVPVRDGPILIVAGSASETTRRQLDACASDGGLAEIRVKTLAVVRAGEEGEAETGRVRSALAAALADGARAVALSLTSSRADIAAAKAVAADLGLSPDQASARLVQALARLTVELVDGRTPLRGLVLTGGDTAKTVLTLLETEAIEILDEIEPGIPLGRISGPHGMLVVTKAGGFGSVPALAKSVERIRSYGG
jgi:uncharacterized protein YgbK (DUF1537 family)